jgi:hypothetical protein
MQPDTDHDNALVAQVALKGAAFGRRDADAAAIRLADIANKHLPEKENLASVIRRLGDSLRELKSRNYSYAELAALVTELGFPINGRTLSSYLHRQPKPGVTSSRFREEPPDHRVSDDADTGLPPSPSDASAPLQEHETAVAQPSHANEGSQRLEPAPAVRTPPTTEPVSGGKRTFAMPERRPQQKA